MRQCRGGGRSRPCAIRCHLRGARRRHAVGVVLRRIRISSRARRRLATRRRFVVAYTRPGRDSRSNAGGRCPPSPMCSVATIPPTPRAICGHVLECSKASGRRPPVEPDFIWLDMPYHDCLSAASRAGVEELCDCLGTRVARFPAPAWFGRLPAAHRIIVEHETAERWRMRGEQSSASLTEMAERGFAHGEERYRAALSEMKQAQRYFSSLFHEHDAVIAPATAGEAPLRMSTGNDDLVFCATWVLCGLPILCVPLLQGDSGLPIGMQLIGSAHQDDRLLRTGRWLIDRILGDAG